jgi:hypothetical protein
MHFHVSRLQGINYYGQTGQLSGCINDVMNVKKYIMECQGYLEEHILVLVDDGKHHFPTRQKIICALLHLVAQSAPGDSVYFHYSGHGGLLTPDYWNRFKAGKLNKEYDETLYPVDHEHSGQIRDFSLFNHFVKPMAAGVTVTCVIDCCHSGSVLDLPYSYQPSSAGKIRMRQSMDSLTNLAYLYILAGGMLPGGGLFDSVMQNIFEVTGESVEQHFGTGVEELSFDTDVAPDYSENVVDNGTLYALQGGDNDENLYDNYVVDVSDAGQPDTIGLRQDVDYGGDVNDFGGGPHLRYDDDLGQNAFGETVAGGCGEGGGDIDCGDCAVGDILGSLLDDF